MRSLIPFFSLLSILTASLPASAGTPRCDKPWVFFDLGDVMIDTSDWDKLRYMPGAHEYLRALKDSGYKTGLIVNIPESWGETFPQKLRALREFVAKTWVEAEPFDWQGFDEVLLPPRDELRKPAPFLFESALRIAGDCPAIYEGEDLAELDTAEKLGMRTWAVGGDPKSLFLPLEKITGWGGPQ